jgi:hypothetical protein
MPDLTGRKNAKRTIQRQHDCSDDLRLLLDTSGSIQELPTPPVTAVHNATQAL